MEDLGIKNGLQLIEEAIAGQFGDRCPEFEPDCYCCKAWGAYDALFARLGLRAESVTDDMVERAAVAIHDLGTGDWNAHRLARAALTAALEGAAS